MIDEVGSAQTKNSIKSSQCFNHIVNFYEVLEH